MARGNQSWPNLPTSRAVVKGDLFLSVKDFGAKGDGSTDDAPAINACLAAAGGGSTVVFPSPTVAYRITVPLTPKSGTTVQAQGKACEVRQATQMKPVFDCFNVDNVTIRGLTLVNSSGPPATAGTTFRGDNGYAYSAGVWSNGNRTVVESCRIKDFAIGVYFNASNGTVNGVAPARVGNRARNLDISGANMGVLFLMQDDLRITGCVSQDHVDSSSGANPLHMVYGTGSTSQRSSNVIVADCHAKNITTPVSSCAYQFKYVDGLTMFGLTADNTNGLLNIIDCNDTVGSSMRGTNLLGQSNGGYAIWVQKVDNIPARLSLDNISLQMTTANASVLGVIADDARISNVYAVVNRTAGGAAFYDVVLRGNRMVLNTYRSRNVGSGAGNNILVGLGATVATSDVSITNPEIDGSVHIADFDQACTGTNVVEYSLARQRRITNAIATQCRATNNGALGGTTSFRVIRQSGWTDSDATTAGEFVPRRENISTNAVVTPSGTMVLRYWTADKTETITTLTAFTGTVAAAATPTVCRMGIYAVADNGDITLVASTPNDTALFSVANTAYSKALSVAFSKQAGVRYATALLVVSGAATPTFHGIQQPGTAPLNTIVRVSPPIIGRVTGQTDLPASVVAASVVGYQACVAMQLS